MTRKKDRQRRRHPDSAPHSESGKIGELVIPENLPPETKQLVQAIISYQGPLPPSAELERYNQIVPGAAARILGWVDDEREHRHQVLSDEVATRSFQTRWGMVFGFIVTVLGLGGSIYLAMHNHEETAKVLGGFTLVAIAAVFVTGRLAGRGGKK